MKILYICTHNRCRSILSEAVTNHIAKGKITARSAGSQPVGEVHPLSLKYLKQRDIDTHGLKSESWDKFEEFAADIVVTVCDSAAQESCPVWFGDSIKIHWGLADPSKLIGTDEEIAAAFNNTITEIERRVMAILAANIDITKSDETQHKLKQLVSEAKSLHD